MKQRVRMTLTVTRDYEIDPESYGVATLDEAIAIDRDGTLQDPFFLLETESDVDVSIVPLVSEDS